MATMKALVYEGPGKKELKDVEKPTIVSGDDAVVRLTTGTICGTDLHILGGDVPAVTPGRILGHEGVGVVEEVGENVSQFKPGDRVIISCVTSCGRCYYCKKGVYAHCEDGGWILGHKINGTQAEYVHIPHADNSLYLLPEGMDEEAAVMLSDIFPTSFEIGILSGKVAPGDNLVIIGAGPIGMAALLTAQLYSPAKIVMVDVDDNRLEVSRQFGATHTVNSKNAEEAIAKIREICDGRGADVVIECVGYPATFDLCQKVVAPCGRIANAGVHGKPVSFDLDRLWIENITLTTGLVSTNTLSMLLKVLQSGRFDPTKLVTHRFAFSDMMNAYDTFKRAADEKALKVIIKFDK